MTSAPTLTVFHRTSQAAALQIIRSGFRDTTGRYLTDREWSGVWVSDRPLDNSEGASGEALLQIEIAEDRLAAFEWIKAGKTYREWLVPAAVLNDAGTVSPQTPRIGKAGAAGSKFLVPCDKWGRYDIVTR